MSLSGQVMDWLLYLGFWLTLVYLSWMVVLRSRRETHHEADSGFRILSIAQIYFDLNGHHDVKT